MLNLVVRKETARLWKVNGEETGAFIKWNPKHNTAYFLVYRKRCMNRRFTNKWYMQSGSSAKLQRERSRVSSAMETNNLTIRNTQPGWLLLTNMKKSEKILMSLKMLWTGTSSSNTTNTGDTTHSTCIRREAEIFWRLRRFTTARTRAYWYQGPKRYEQAVRGITSRRWRQCICEQFQRRYIHSTFYIKKGLT